MRKTIIRFGYKQCEQTWQHPHHHQPHDHKVAHPYRPPLPSCPVLPLFPGPPREGVFNQSQKSVCVWMSMFCWWHSHLPHKHTLAVKLIKYTALTVEQHHSLINARIDSILIWLWWIRWMCVGSLGPFGALLKWTSEHFTLASPPPQTVIKHQACDWPIKGESNRINQLCALWNKEENRIELQAKPERESRPDQMKMSIKAVIEQDTSNSRPDSFIECAQSS